MEHVAKHPNLRFSESFFLLYLVMVMFSPSLYGGYSSLRLDNLSSLLIFLFAIPALIWKKGKFPLLNKGLWICFLAILFSIILSGWIGPYPGFTRQSIVIAFAFFRRIVIFYVALLFLKRRDFACKALRWLLFMAGIHGVIAFLMLIKFEPVNTFICSFYKLNQYGHVDTYKQSSGIFYTVHPLAFLCTNASLICIALLLFKDRLIFEERRKLQIVLVLSILGVVVSNTRTTFIILIIGLLYFTLFLSIRRKTKLVSGIILVCMGIILLVPIRYSYRFIESITMKRYYALHNKQHKIDAGDSIFEGRRKRFELFYDGWMESPYFGVGVNIGVEQNILYDSGWGILLYQTGVMGILAELFFMMLFSVHYYRLARKNKTYGKSNYGYYFAILAQPIIFSVLLGNISNGALTSRFESFFFISLAAIAVITHNVGDAIAE